jgi:hypothetical protein
MIIGVAGPYSAATDRERQDNLEAMNRAAAELIKKGHIPFIGVNAALPVALQMEEKDRYETLMKISLALIDCCDALLLLQESPGANRERDLILAKRLPLYRSVNEVPSLF